MIGSVLLTLQLLLLTIVVTGGCTLLRLWWWSVYWERDIGVDVLKVICPALGRVLDCQGYNGVSGLTLLPGNSGTWICSYGFTEVMPECLAHEHFHTIGVPMLIQQVG